ncbi:hypothetical protein BJ912DRAFT_926580 [Pholiota molesta]|nr:hypothetical protein BJ912DRAFT_926580 [Pholiota molesta]
MSTWPAAASDWPVNFPHHGDGTHSQQSGWRTGKKSKKSKKRYKRVSLEELKERLLAGKSSCEACGDERKWAADRLQKTVFGIPRSSDGVGPSRGHCGPNIIPAYQQQTERDDQAGSDSAPTDVMFVSLFSTGNVRKTAVVAMHDHATQCAQAFVVRLCEKLRVVSMTACSRPPRNLLIRNFYAWYVLTYSSVTCNFFPKWSSQLTILRSHRDRPKTS